MEFTAYDGDTYATRVGLLRRDLPLNFSKKVVNISKPIDAWVTFLFRGNVTRGHYVANMYYSYIETNMSSYWAKTEIDSLLSQGYLISTKASDFEHWPRQFEPDSIVSVANAVVWLVEAMPFEINSIPAQQWNGDKEAYDKYFIKYGYQAVANDIKIENSWAQYSYIALFSFIDAGLKKEMLVPKMDGKLGLEDRVTRAQFCQMVTRLMGWPEDKESVNFFWDLKDPQWSSYLGAIGSCLNKGIMKGYKDGSFYPEGTMTRAEVAVAIYKLLGLGSAPENPNSVTPTHTTLVQSFQVGIPTMTVNGKSVAMDVTPTVMQDRTLLPARYVAEPIGANVTWSPTDQKVTITSTRPWVQLNKTVSTTTATIVELRIGNPTAKVNGVEMPIDPANPKVTPLILPPGRTMVPLRFIGEALGAQVSWNPDTREIVIISSPSQPLEENTLPPP